LLALQSKPKPAPFINGVDLSSLALELGRPMDKGFISEALRWLGINSTLLFDHHIIILVHVDSKLDRASAPIKLRWGSSSEDNSVFK
jgi:hypothetical protein